MMTGSMSIASDVRLDRIGEVPVNAVRLCRAGRFRDSGHISRSDGIGRGWAMRLGCPFRMVGGAAAPLPPRTSPDAARTYC